MTIDAVLPRLEAKGVKIALGNAIGKPAELCCDGGAAIKALARRANLLFHVRPSIRRDSARLLLMIGSSGAKVSARR